MEDEDELREARGCVNGILLTLFAIVWTTILLSVGVWGMALMVRVVGIVTP